MKDRIAIVAGVRTPFCKAGGVLKDAEADELGAFIVSELMARSGVSGELVDELVFGNVTSEPQMANIARLISVKGGLPLKSSAVTISRNCASGMEAISIAVDKIQVGQDEVVVAGGTESMSNFPLPIKKSYREYLSRLKKAKGWKQLLMTLFGFRPSMVVPEFPEISDPLCGLSMGQTAEALAREFHVTKEEQDAFALRSQQRASSAIKEGRLAPEIAPIPVAQKYTTIQQNDDGPRDNQTLDALSKLKPCFDKVTGTVTAGTSSQITDGAVALLLMKESKAKELGLSPLGYIRDYAVAGLQPGRMGLGPVFATAKLLKRTGLQLKDFDLIEINEAFAAQVLAVVKAAASDEFAKKELGLDKALGVIDMDKLNVNGGAIALGHPLGASGARLVLTLLMELRRRNKNLGLATLCVGGGQGQAIAVEVK